MFLFYIYFTIFHCKWPSLHKSINISPLTMRFLAFKIVIFHIVFWFTFINESFHIPTDITRDRPEEPESWLALFFQIATDKCIIFLVIYGRLIHVSEIKYMSVIPHVFFVVTLTHRQLSTVILVNASPTFPP